MLQRLGTLSTGALCWAPMVPRLSNFQGLKPLLCPDRRVATGKYDLLSEGGQSLSPREGEREGRGWERRKGRGEERGKGKDDLHPTLFLGPAPSKKIIKSSTGLLTPLARTGGRRRTCEVEELLY